MGKFRKHKQSQQATEISRKDVRKKVRKQKKQRKNAFYQHKNVTPSITQGGKNISNIKKKMKTSNQVRNTN